MSTKPTVFTGGLSIENGTQWILEKWYYYQRLKGVFLGDELKMASAPLKVLAFSNWRSYEKIRICRTVDAHTMKTLKRFDRKEPSRVSLIEVKWRKWNVTAKSAVMRSKLITKIARVIWGSIEFGVMIDSWSSDRSVSADRELLGFGLGLEHVSCLAAIQKVHMIYSWTLTSTR